MRWFTLPVLLGLSLLVLAGWWLANRPVDPAPGVRVDKFASLSFSAYRAWESPLTDHFPTMAEADADMALLAPVTRAVRTYAAVEGSLDTAALAQKHGVKLWQGIWLGADRAKNDIEMARGIALARRYPGTIERVIVGNEVLLRRDLPPEELIADIDKVKAAVKQPVAYADVWDFWKQFPQVAPHVDIMLIHLLPYWEDVPTGIDRAVAHVGDAYAEMKRLFPGSKIAIGETGWPSRGRERADAVPSRVNETRFLREFIALSQREHFDYNFIEAFDQAWKYQSEGVVGASWGIFDSDRAEKIPLRGAVTENPAWLRYAGLSVGIGLILAMCGCFRVPPGSFRTHMAVLGAAMALGSACAWGRSIAGPRRSISVPACCCPGSPSGGLPVACPRCRRVPAPMRHGGCRACIRSGCMACSRTRCSCSAGLPRCCRCCWCSTRATATFRCLPSSFQFWSPPAGSWRAICRWPAAGVRRRCLGARWWRARLPARFRKAG
jgi:exo-beta-1,3-glucanase (GH17 family)